MEHIKIINAQQAKPTNAYKNKKQKLLKTYAAIWFNKISPSNHLTPKYTLGENLVNKIRHEH
jgi:hypothetical protein